jgi:hypothetical protein
VLDLFQLFLSNARPHNKNIRGEPLILSGFRSIFKWRREQLNSTQPAIQSFSRVEIPAGREGYSGPALISTPLPQLAEIHSRRGSLNTFRTHESSGAEPQKQIFRRWRKMTGELRPWRTMTGTK